MKRGIAAIIIILLMLLFPFAIAQEDAEFSLESEPSQNEQYSSETESSEIVQQVEEEFQDAELKEGAGITPDSPFYFVEDGILSNFRGDLENREKKVAEIEAMIETGNIDAAKDSLERYEKYADNLEKEVNPERRDDAFRSAVAIRKTINGIQGDIPEEDREEFDNILEQEENIVTATEISSKIKELCETLSKLDPLEYSRICKIEEDSPRWQRDLNQKLTKEQEQEAKVFFDIMSQCFDTSGRECRCEEIPISSFAEKCSTIAPLAAACDDGDEDACDEMEKIEQEEPIENLLPDYLQDTLARAEGKYTEGRYDMRMPPECEEAGAKTPKDCVRIMFKIHAPEECQAALERGEIDPTNEKQARELCDKIMFEANAPPECVKAGISNPKECGKIIFQSRAPEECIEAGITGENKGDDKKCREIMEQFGTERTACPSGEYPGINDQGQQSCIRGQPIGGGGNCRGIQVSAERLKCYDSASQGFGEQIEKVEMERKEVREYRKEKNEGQKCPDGNCDEFEQT